MQKSQLVKYRTDVSKEYETSERCSIIEILNEADHPEFSIAQARVKPGVTTSLHSLKSTNEIYYILSGSGLAEMDGKKYELKKGDVLYIPKEKAQSIMNNGKVDLVFLCICNPRFQQENYKNLELG